MLLNVIYVLLLKAIHYCRVREIRSFPSATLRRSSNLGFVRIAYLQGAELFADFVSKTPSARIVAVSSFVNVDKISQELRRV